MNNYYMEHQALERVRQAEASGRKQRLLMDRPPKPEGTLSRLFRRLFARRPQRDGREGAPGRPQELHPAS